MELLEPFLVVCLKDIQSYMSNEIAYKKGKYYWARKTKNDITDTGFYLISNSPERKPFDEDSFYELDFIINFIPLSELRNKKINDILDDNDWYAE